MNPIRTARWAALALAAALVGCDNSTAPSSSPSSTPAPSPGGGPPPPGKAANPAAGKKAEAAPAKPLDVAGTKLSDKEVLAVEKLESEGDRKIALEQKLCPISGAHLGAMGKPFKVTLKDQAVFLCCDGCEEDAKAKPGEALAKLGR